jgi:hypothetical protein
LDVDSRSKLLQQGCKTPLGSLGPGVEIEADDVLSLSFGIWSWHLLLHQTPSGSCASKGVLISLLPMLRVESFIPQGNHS